MSLTQARFSQAMSLTQARLPTRWEPRPTLKTSGRFSGSPVPGPPAEPGRARSKLNHSTGCSSAYTLPPTRSRSRRTSESARYCERIASPGPPADGEAGSNSMTTPAGSTSCRRIGGRRPEELAATTSSGVSRPSKGPTGPAPHALGDPRSPRRGSGASAAVAGPPVRARGAPPPSPLRAAPSPGRGRRGTTASDARPPERPPQETGTPSPTDPPPRSGLRASPPPPPPRPPRPRSPGGVRPAAQDLAHELQLLLLAHGRQVGHQEHPHGQPPLGVGSQRLELG